MRRSVLVLCTVLVVSSSCAQPKIQSSFEGIITYKVLVTTKAGMSDYGEYQRQKYGDMLKVSIAKDGSFKREYITSGQKGFSFFSYDASTNKLFTKWRNIDTVYSSSSYSNSMTLLNEKTLETEFINGQPCAGYFISAVEPRGGQTVSLTYYYPKHKEYINPELYKRYEDFFYNKVVERIKAPFYKLIMDMGNYVVVFEVEMIETKTIDPTIIKIPDGVPVKEM